MLICKMYKYTLFGILMGILLHRLHQKKSAESSVCGVIEGRHPTPKEEKFTILVGVMTAQKYLDTRAVAAYNTWAKTIPGQVIFFSTEGTINFHNFTVVALEGVDDTYPPQKKSFMMMKYIYDNFMGDFEWFLRADDDVYVRGDKLEPFLRSINSSKPQYIGQHGGTGALRSNLSLKAGENYCMGGPSILFSKTTLKHVVEHLDECLAGVQTKHEDVEIGRCVRQHAGIACTWVNEMQEIFFHNFQEPNGSFSGPLHTRNMVKIIVMHPVKQPAYAYRLHNHMTSKRALEKGQRLMHLKREIWQMNKTVVSRNHGVIARNQISFEYVKTDLHSLRDNIYEPHFLSRSTVATDPNDILEWDFFRGDYFSVKRSNLKQGNSRAFQWALHHLKRVTTNVVSQNNRLHLNWKEFYSVETTSRSHMQNWREYFANKFDPDTQVAKNWFNYPCGYRTIHPMRGVDYAMDVLKFVQYTEPHTYSVIDHIYLRQPFLDIELVVECDTKDHLYPYVHDTNSLNDLTHLKGDDQMVHLVVPLSGRHRRLQAFMTNFENECLKQNANAKLHFGLFRTNDTDYKNNIELINKYQRQYPKAKIERIPIDGDFSRGIGLTMGAANLNDDALLCFMDVDIEFRNDFFRNVRRNTKYGRQVYLPIVFAQYKPAPYNSKESNTTYVLPNPFTFSNDVGFWGVEGFGMASMYKYDLVRVGGFDTKIQGWGFEDVNLLDKLVYNNVTVFRAPDLNLVHIYHESGCRTKLPSRKKRMCSGSTLLKQGSQKYFANTVFNIFNSTNSTIERMHKVKGR